MKGEERTKLINFILCKTRFLLSFKNLEPEACDSCYDSEDNDETTCSSSAKVQQAPLRRSRMKTFQARGQTVVFHLNKEELVKSYSEKIIVQELILCYCKTQYSNLLMLSNAFCSGELKIKQNISLSIKLTIYL